MRAETQAAVLLYPGPDQSAVRIHGLVDADVLTGKMKRFLSQREVNAGLPDVPPVQGLPCHRL